MASARGAACSSYSDCGSSIPRPRRTVLRGTTLKPARVSTASTQSAHMRSSGA